MDIAGKRCLVTGSTGLIGNNLVAELCRRNACVIASGRSEEKLRRYFGSIPDCSVCAFDISKENIPESVGNVDYIFHAASPISGKAIRETPVDVISSNIQGTINVLSYLKNQKAKTGYSGKMIVFSSATVYGPAKEGDFLVTENDTEHAFSLADVNSSYAESKRMAEVIALSYFKQYDIPISIARISYVYGFAPVMPETALYGFIRNALKSEDIVLNGASFPRRDNIHVSDVVSGLITIALRGASGEAYNISSSGMLDNFAAVDEIAQIIATLKNKGNSEGERKIKVLYNNTFVRGGGGVLFCHRKKLLPSAGNAKRAFKTA